MMVDKIVKKLMENYHTGSFSSDPFRVLITTILSQRTTGENTAKASKRLFSTFTTPREMAEARVKEIEELIKPSGFYRIKAKRIKEVSRIIAEKYSGKLPAKLEELLSLPGVGRKTANCVLVYGFGKSALPVDTHVHRVSNRLGLVKTKTPEDTEEALRKRISKEYWININELFVKFGRDICRPLKPKCNACFLRAECDSAASKKLYNS